jgi:hypothetical protein
MATGYTLLRQDEDIRKSETYDDTVAPTLAAFETNPADINDDLNNVRSMLSHLLDVQVGNWYDVIPTPSNFENGAQRGVADLNQDLHDQERKRFLIEVHSVTDLTVPAAVNASETLTISGAISDLDQVEVGGQTYTLRTPFVDAANNIDASGSIAQTCENIRRAINGDGVAGINYGTGTPTNTSVTATDTATTVVATAIAGGTQGNSITCTDPTDAGGVLNWGGATLSGGAGDVMIVAAANVPNTTAAVGASTELGTVVAFHTGTFGEHSLDEVAGSTALVPKNLIGVFDGDSRDPITDSNNKRIYALLQSEVNTDPHTINDTTQQVQVSFVVSNATGDDLVAVDGADIGGQTINMCFNERFAFEDLTEEVLLRGAILDVPGGTTVNRQVAYDNQGATPVELTNNAILDLNSAGIYWEIRDLLNATLMRLTEGSTGGNTTLQIGADVDVFDVDAVDNDFNAGISANTGGTRPIDVGVTDGVVESTAGALQMKGFTDLTFTDQYEPGSWSLDGVPLSQSAAGWTDYESAFGEVGLLEGIVAAYNAGADPTRTFHELGANVAKDANVGGPSTTANNVDVDFPDALLTNFTTDHWLFLNGRLMRPGADATANYDYYPGSVFSAGDVNLAFERNLKSGDIIVTVYWP